MERATSIAELRRWRAGKTSVGFVPTMGYLHEGHLSLVRRCRAENERTVVSIFVNPLQFGPREDFASYPRDLERDAAMLEREGVDLLFCPSPEEMYPGGFDVAVDPGAVAAPLDGTSRPGHFRGVATVVLKLFNQVQAQRAYFGQKDAQQLAVIRKMVLDLDVPVEIVPCPTLREPDGLAMSSRNVYLSPEQRRAAPVLYRALWAARERQAAGERRAEELRSAMRDVLGQEPLAHVDYVSVANPDTLAELEQVEGPALASMAVRIGTTRLIDNLVLGT